MAITHTPQQMPLRQPLTRTPADIEQETPKSRRNAVARVGAGLEPWQTGKKKPHDHALASILGPRSWRPWPTSIQQRGGPTHPARDTATCWCGCWCSPTPWSVLIQYQSAKLGIVTNKSLPELLGERKEPMPAASCSLCRPRSSYRHRSGRGDRRRHRPEPAVRISTVHRRFGDWRNLHGDAFVVPRRQRHRPHSSASSSRDAADYHIRLIAGLFVARRTPAKWSKA